MTEATRFENALRAWREVLDEERVTDAPEVIDVYSRSTHGCGTRPVGVLYPQSTAEVQGIVRVANEERVPIYPISCGKNWGYGDACAPVGGCAIVDLSRMNGIVEVDEKLAYAVVEPGVTQGQLWDRLQGTNLWMDSTGAGPDASIVGNALERGFGHTAYADHARCACGLEVVLANGECLRTGFGHFENAQAGALYPYGMGPQLDGLFFQSNLGIVTQMGVWLMPKPEAFGMFFLTMASDENLDALIEALRPLRLAGVLNSAVHVANDLRIFSSKGRFPFDDVPGGGALPHEARMKIRSALGAGAWTLSASLMGTKAHVAGARRALRQALRPFGMVRFVDDRRVALAERLTGILPGGFGKKLAEQLRVLRPNYALSKGQPNRESLHGAYWRVRDSDGGDGDLRDGNCGLMWVSPVLPMTGRDAQVVMAIAEQILADHGLDLLMTFTLINERAMVAVIQIAFDKSEADECARAEGCYRALLVAFKDGGYYPYRLSPQAMDLFRDEGDVFWQTAGQLKETLDPNNILAPGRYIPSRDA